MVENVYEIVPMSQVCLAVLRVSAWRARASTQLGDLLFAVALEVLLSPQVALEVLSQRAVLKET